LKADFKEKLLTKAGLATCCACCATCKLVNRAILDHVDRTPIAPKRSDLPTSGSAKNGDLGITGWGYKKI
jgi:hypothetical protein